MTSICEKCGGQGWYQDHAPMGEHYADANGQPACQICPIQVQCEVCEGTGELPKELN